MPAPGTDAEARAAQARRTFDLDGGAVVSGLLGDEREAEPRAGAFAAGAPRANGSKIRSRSASGTPGPSSSTRQRRAPVVSVDVDGAPGRPWRAAFSSRLSTSERRPGSQPRSRTGVVGQIGARRSCRGGARATAHRGVGDLGEVDLGRAPARRRRGRAPAGRRAARRAGAAARAPPSHPRALLGRRSRDGGPATRASPGSLVSGVRSSCPASAAKRRVASSARSRSAAVRPRRASIALNDAASARGSLRPAVGGDAAVEVLVAGDARRRGAQPRERAQDEAGREEHERGRDGSASAPSSASRRRKRSWRASRLARRVVSSSRARPPRLGSRSVVGVRAVADAARARRSRTRRAAARSRGGGSPASSSVVLAEAQPQRRARGREHRVEAVVGGGQLLLHGGQRRGARELGRAQQPVVERLALGAVDVARGEQPAPRAARRRRRRSARASVGRGGCARGQGRRTKPTPRTVCSTRGSPPASSLRRR